MANDAIQNSYVATLDNSSGTITAFKLNSAAELVWQKSLSSLAFGGQICYDSSGYVYVLSQDTTASTYIVLTKIDASSGDVVWATRYLGDVFARNIALDSSGNVYICGADSFLLPYQSMYILKFNSSGALQWQRKLSGPSQSVSPSAIAIDSFDNIYAVGVNNGSPFISWVAKYNSSGVFQWVREVYDSSNVNSYFAYAIATDANSNVYIGGPTNIVTFGGGVVTKLDSSGNLVWQKNIASAGTIYNMYITPNNYIYMTNTPGGGIIKIDTDGTGIFFNKMNPTTLGRIFVNNTNMYFCARGANGAGYQSPFVGCLPSDGSKTGVINASYTYSSQTLTIAPSTMSVRTPSYTASTPTISTGSYSVTASNTTYTNTVTYF
jgi:hypothetical protein